MRWTRCAQIVFRYLLLLFPTVWAERRKNSLTSAFLSSERREWERLGLKYASPLKRERAKATPFGFCLQHCLHQLRNSSPKIYSCYDCQLYSQLQISHKIERGRERGNYKDLKFGKISRVVGGSLLSVEYWQSGWLFVKRGRENPNISDQQTNIRTSRQGPITRGVGGR